MCLSPLSPGVQIMLLVFTFDIIIWLGVFLSLGREMPSKNLGAPLGFGAGGRSLTSSLLQIIPMKV